MDRKDFLTTTMLALGAGRAASAGQKQRDDGQRFRQAWIQSLMENLDAQVDEPARIRLMEACGRACARRGSLAGAAKDAKGNVDKLVAALAHHVGKENARREGNVVHLSYPTCYCPLVAAGPPRLSNTYCNCSRGYVLEIFETAAGHPVQVELTHSIKRGDAACRFVIRL